jgi:NAD(P)H-nitrite reductase large subunit
MEGICVECVIIGNSVAGISASEAIRANDRNGTITIISKENYMAYGRPLISYLLANKIECDKIYLRDKDSYEKKKINVLLGMEAVKINVKRNEVFLSNGKSLNYDKLLIATGGSPIRLPVQDVETQGIFHFNMLDDVFAIEKVLEKVNSAVVIGGGLIGLKATEALTERGIKVTMIELMNKVLPTVLDDESAMIFADSLKKDNANLELKNTVEKIVVKNGKVSGVILKDKKEIECQMVIVAIGVRPNIKITEGTGIKVNRGIIVNEKMETNVENIYAAGDVTEAYDILYKDKRSVPIWHSAYQQGEIAGENMSGLETRYDGTCSMNSIGYKDTHMISIGIINTDNSSVEILKKFERDKGIYKRMNIVDKKLIGAIFVGDVANKGIITNLIKKGVDVSPYKSRLLEDDFGLVDLDKEFRIKLLKS